MASHSWYTTERARALRALDDEGLLATLRAFVGQERESLAELLEHLMELDRRGTQIDRGYPSLFAYCVKGLGYSERAAYLRIRAVRVARDIPLVLEHLREGRLHLETIARLSKHLRQDNAEALLPRALGATKREVLALVAELEPVPVERDIVVPIAPAVSVAKEPVAPPAADAAVPPLVRPQIVPPLRHRIHFTADDELVRLLERLRSLLRHKYPDGRLEELVKESARSLLDRIDPDRAKPCREPRAPRKRSRRVPQMIKRRVWTRDGGRCAFLSEDGRRCDSREALEYDHIRPWALGGASDDASNIRLLCRSHNQRAAQRFFGPRGAGYGRP